MPLSCRAYSTRKSPMGTPVFFLNHFCPRPTQTRPSRTKLEMDVDEAEVPLVGINIQQYCSSYTVTMIPLGGLFLDGLGSPVSYGVVVDLPALAPAGFDDVYQHGPSMMAAPLSAHSVSQTSPPRLPRVFTISAVQPQPPLSMGLPRLPLLRSLKALLWQPLSRPFVPHQHHEVLRFLHEPVLAPLRFRGHLEHQTSQSRFR